MTEQVLYGVWILNIGWLRGEQSRALMFGNKDVAIETAHRIGGAKVYFIDQSLVDIEDKLLDAEVRNNIPFFARIHAVLKAQR